MIEPDWDNIWIQRWYVGETPEELSEEYNVPLDIMNRYLEGEHFDIVDGRFESIGHFIPEED